MAEDPDYRYSLANERTFLSWIRTSLGLLAGGVAVLTVLTDVGHPAAQVAVGVVLLALALVVPLQAYRRWAATEQAMRTGQSLPGPGLIRLVSGGLVLVVLLVLVLLVS